MTPPPDPPPSSALALRPAEAALAQADAAAQEAIDASIPANTRRAYEFELHCFAAWCTRHGVAAIPAEARTIRVYLRELADQGRTQEDLPPQRQARPVKAGGLGLGTVLRALAAVCRAHVRAGLPSPWRDPKVTELREALEREKGVRPTKKRALDNVLMRQLISAIPRETLLGKRDRAMLLLGWTRARRRSEIVAAHVEHFEKHRKGYLWLIPRSKTDQVGAGLEVAVDFEDDERFCPVLALDAWLLASGITSGPVFRALLRDGSVAPSALTGEMVALRVKYYAAAAGLDAAEFAGHSLRSGWITTAARAGLSGHTIRRVSGHRSQAMVEEYIQHESAFEASGKGLI